MQEQTECRQTSTSPFANSPSVRSPVLRRQKELDAFLTCFGVWIKRIIAGVTILRGLAAPTARTLEPRGLRCPVGGRMHPRVASGDAKPQKLRRLFLRPTPHRDHPPDREPATRLSNLRLACSLETIHRRDPLRSNGQSRTLPPNLLATGPRGSRRHGQRQT